MDFENADGETEAESKRQTKRTEAAGSEQLVQEKKNGTLASGAELTEARIKKLDAIGMIWTPKRETAWEGFYDAASDYYQRFGNLNIPTSYITAEGRHLGKWIRRQREARGRSLREDRMKKLEAIGMIWK